MAPQGAGHGAAPPGKLCGSRVPAPGRCWLGPAALPNSSARRVPGLELNLPAAAKEKPPPAADPLLGRGAEHPCCAPWVPLPSLSLGLVLGSCAASPSPACSHVREYTWVCTHACVQTLRARGLKDRRIHAPQAAASVPRRTTLAQARRGDAWAPGDAPPQSVCPCGGQEDSPGPTLPRGTGGQPRTLTPRAPYHFPWQLPPRQLRFRSGAAAEPAGYL